MSFSNGPPAAAPNLAIATQMAPASVRLSTTPHFPSPLAQASGPDEDNEQSKGEDGDGESESEKLADVVDEFQEIITLSFICAY